MWYNIYLHKIVLNAFVLEHRDNPLDNVNYA